MAKWDRGKLIDGKYFFYDNLAYIDSQKQQAKKLHKWKYCTENDRRFYTEVSRDNLRPDGLTLLTNDIKGPKKIPEGCYDIGDGYFDPVKRVICEYNSNFKRDLKEDEWIIDKCRYEPNIFYDAVEGNNDKIIAEMIQLNQNPVLREERMKGLQVDLDE